MASARKKMDEKHLKVLRVLASSSSNKYCFDCHQRGPTYVNVTIGSFVCTKCSGILRGLTPPHRVKSISMATFTQEEVDQLMSKGNEYCQKVWLALCESEPPTKDELQIKDFMIDKYEKKRYYVEPSIAMKMSSFNGISSSSQTNSSSNSAASSNVSSSSNIVLKNKLETIVSPKSKENNNSRLYTNGNVSSLEKSMKITPIPDPFESSVQPAQTSFANFDNAAIFNATSTVPGFSNCGGTSTQAWTPPPVSPFLRQTPHSHYSQTNRWSTGSLMTAPISSTPAVPTEDRYAALKDLDSLMKSQIAANNTVPSTPAQEPLQPVANNTDPWGSNVAQPTANGVWNSTHVIRPKEASNPINGFNSNPFANDNWGSENGINSGELSKNPFKNSKLFSDWPGSNGANDMTTSQSFNTFQWLSNNHANPFAVGGFAGSPPTNSAYHSSNPFL